MTQVYIRTEAYRKTVLLLNYAAENGIKKGIFQLWETINSIPQPVFLSEEEFKTIQNDFSGNYEEILGLLTGSLLEREEEEKTDISSWSNTFIFSQPAVRNMEKFYLLDFQGTIESIGKLNSLPQEKTAFLDLSLQAGLGYLPLSFFPLLVEKQMTPSEKDEFIQKHKVEITGEKELFPSLNLSFPAQEIVPEVPEKLIGKALKIDVFYPEDLSPWRIRQALGLEISSEPVPDGIYLIKDDLGLGGLFIQGEVTEMLLGIENKFQVISFDCPTGTWLIKFSPTEQQTIFLTPWGQKEYCSSPRGIIVVNGIIHSLRAGEVTSDGEIIPASERIPCLLSGLQLTIISSNEITITSDLFQQGLNWQEGVPYLKDQSSQLFIFAGSRDLLSGDKGEGEIIIETGENKEITIQANLSASEEGLSVEGRNKEVKVVGSLQTSQLNSGSSSIEVFYNRNLDDWETAPLTREPVLLLISLKALEWRGR